MLIVGRRQETNQTWTIKHKTAEGPNQKSFNVPGKAASSENSSTNDPEVEAALERLRAYPVILEMLRIGPPDDAKPVGDSERRLLDCDATVLDKFGFVTPMTSLVVAANDDFHQERRDLEFPPEVKDFLRKQSATDLNL